MSRHSAKQGFGPVHTNTTVVKHNLSNREIVRRLAPMIDAQAIPRLHMYFGTTSDNVVRDAGHSPIANSSEEAANMLRPFFEIIEHRESFWVLLLNRAVRVIGAVNISEGGIHGTVCDPKLVFGSALMAQASGVVLAHNHPSGQLRPSPEDLTLTKRLVEAGRMLNIDVHDHLILTASGHFSFADNGMLTPYA